MPVRFFDHGFIFPFWFFSSQVLILIHIIIRGLFFQPTQLEAFNKFNLYSLCDKDVLLLFLLFVIIQCGSVISDVSTIVLIFLQTGKL